MSNKPSKPHSRSSALVTLVLAVAVAAGVTAWLMAGGDRKPADGSAGDPALRLAAGARLYAEQCAACHGADLEGDANWRERKADGTMPAPPHDDSGHTWHHPDRFLVAYTKYGGAEVLRSMGIDAPSAMPAFGEQLSDAEIVSVLDFIKSHWSDRARIAQAKLTAEDLRNQ